MKTAFSGMAAYIAIISKVNDWIGRVVAWLVLGVVFTTFIVVLMRYLLNQGSVFLQEIVLYFHNYIIMLGAVYALVKGAHVRVDIFYRPMDEHRKAWVNLLGFIFLLMPTCVFIFYISWDYVAASWAILEGSQEAGGVDAKYLFKTSILFMPLLLLLQGLAQALMSILTLCNGSEQNLTFEERAS